jgi:hypothetical protein
MSKVGAHNRSEAAAIAHRLLEPYALIHEVPSKVMLDSWSKRALNWTPGEHFTSASTVGRDLGERRQAQRFPVVC